MSFGIEDSDRMVDGWVRQAQERATKYQAMAERFAEMSVTERSADGTVELTVSSKGILTDLRISEQAGARRMAEVSAEVMRTLQRAQSRIPELLQDVLTETVGTQDGVANHVVDEAKKTFPEPPEDEEAESDAMMMRFDAEITDDPEPTSPPPPSQRPSAPPPRRPRRDDDDDDGMQDSIYS
ncbi:YbaB/EbfC family nucleoid-associated protein [Actinophytocola sp.]|uniref:YbaB/EbfC family nucleoid-associated protein n=1 Tax=Actinophytocola sp. TaxID=1872138 RepID=UPI002ED39C35